MTAHARFELLMPRATQAVRGALRYCVDVDDAVQVGLIELWKALVNQPGQADSWLVARAVLYARTYVRSQQRHIHDDIAVTPSACRVADPEGCIDFSEWLATLPVFDRQVSMLLAAGYTQAEIGERLNVNRMRVVRAVARIRAAVEQNSPLSALYT